VGDVQIAQELINISAMAESLTEQLEPVAASTNVAVRSNGIPDIKIIGDASWIERIILNLVDNAIKFTPAGGHVEVRVAADAASVILEVKDNAIGIPAAAIPRLFERFLSCRAFKL
jgi:two-component system, OmpR family, phosphate regulon sensor histidine kinase PhoR